MNIKNISPRENGFLYVISEDGRSGLMDVRPYFDYPAFQRLRETNEFNKVRNGRYFVEWSCGADLSADTIEARWIPVEEENAQQQNPAVGS